MCLGQWRDGLGRVATVWTPRVLTFRRFESELSKTALTVYAARNLLLLSLEGASRLGPLLTPLPRSKRRTCALWVLLMVKAMNWLFCTGWTKRGSSMWHTWILSEQQDHEGPLPVQRGHVVHRTGRSPCEAGYHAAVTTTSALPLFFMQAVIGVDPETLTLEYNLTTCSQTSLAGLWPLGLSTTLQTRRNSLMF